MMVLRQAAVICALLAGTLLPECRPKVHRMDGATVAAAVEGVWYIPSLDACAAISDMRMHIGGAYGVLAADPEGYSLTDYGQGHYTVELPATIDTRRHGRAATVQLRLSADGSSFELVSPRNGWRVNLLYLLMPRLGRGVRHDTVDRQPTPTAIRPVAGFSTRVSL